MYMNYQKYNKKMHELKLEKDKNYLKKECLQSFISKDLEKKLFKNQQSDNDWNIKVHQAWIEQSQSLMEHVEGNIKQKAMSKDTVEQ